ncbi:DsbA family protein [Longimicrobium terrae]|uniref:Protein-disulfide isomerase n=1 Tax=Longimicrobium terrae TaxID=1639882 RepID=A0A841GYH4_9BACT|nr:DsbA family protein [Longimicrobium terrae]MBB4636674.1 protein-disulfide isomerase [Longimicrobium terrae]MBB6070802.1 protein-disulfide isomerase [Longimicrobium terrae]NNC28828.1 DsbA family protein [Longimicrobium terrae]
MANRDTFQNLLSVVLALCAIVVTGILVRREFFPGTRSVEGTTVPSTVSDWAQFGMEGHRIGASSPQVTIVEFSDFQCPFCRVLALRLDTLRAEFPNEIAVVYRHHPLAAIHPHAVAAVGASECAARQGRFWAMHDALYAGQDSIGSRTWARFAEAAGVEDAAGFDACMKENAVPEALTSDTAAGNALQVHSTPTLLINQFRLAGAAPLDTLRAYVARARSTATPHPRR